MRAIGVFSPKLLLVTWPLLLAVWAVGCGGGLSDVSLGKPEPEVATPARYAAALRLAALARVEARAGSDEVAAEHFRAAYRKYPDVGFLLAYARSAERAKLYAEAHDALRRALTHALADDEKTRINNEVERLQPLVPAGLVRVAIQVSPEGARVELTRQQAGAAGRDPKKNGPGRTVDRVVLGTGWLFLQPGSWAIYSTAKGYQSDLSSLQVTPEGAELVAVGLSPEDAGPQFADTTRPKVVRQEGPDLEPKKPEEGPVVEFQAPARPSRSRIHSIGPVVVSALGVLAVGAGGYFGWQATEQAKQANALLPSDSGYHDDFATFRTSVNNNAMLANYAFIGGGALVGLGTLWWLLAPSKTTAAADRPSGAPVAARLLPAVQLTPSGVALNWKL